MPETISTANLNSCVSTINTLTGYPEGTTQELIKGSYHYQHQGPASHSLLRVANSKGKLDCVFDAETKRDLEHKLRQYIRGLSAKLNPLPCAKHKE